jgi:uridine kinase
MRPGDAKIRGKTGATRVVGIAGPSGSGKTTLAQAVAERVRGGGVVFALDAYYRDRRGVDPAEIDVDIPEAIDHELALEHLRALAAGQRVAQPEYDFSTHSRTAQSRILEPAPFVVVEGLFALYWAEVRDLVHTRVFVTLDHNECLRRRIERDVRERGRIRSEVTSQYENKVRPMYDRFIDATRNHAHLVLDGRASVDILAQRILNVLDTPSP